MKRSLPPLPALRAFEAAARHLSFTHAAEELSVTQSAISRQVRALEDYLQRKLFLRLTRKVELTEEGQAYFQAIRLAFDRIEEATASTIGRRARTVLTIAVLPTLASLWLMPRLSSFWRANRDIEIRTIVSTEPVDFAAQRIDMALKVGRLPGKRYGGRRPPMDGDMVRDWRGVRADRLFPDVLVPVCSRAWLASAPPLKRLQDLARHRLIHTAIRRHAWRDWLAAQDVQLEQGVDDLDCGQYFMSLQAAQAGEGVALVPSVLLDSFDPERELVRPFDATLASAGDYCLLTPAARYEVRAVRLFREWILEQASV
jgi:LysR family glycine cleavage system transcriptional activator